MSDRHLTFDQSARVLRLLSGLNIVLVGGQALNHWCRQFEDAPELEGKVFTSKDVDFQGTASDMYEAAERLHGEPVRAAKGPTTFLGYVQFQPDDGEGAAKVDFLSAPEGLAASDVYDGSIEIDIDDIHLRVMHPVHCLASRVANVMTIPNKYDNDHGVSQLRAAIVCVREYFQLLIAAENQGLYPQVEVVLRLSAKPTCVKLYNEKRIDVLEALPRHGLADNFYEKRLPQMKRLLLKRGRLG